jgi:hypothetical protein
MYHGRQFTTPATLRQLFLVVGSLSLIYRTFIVTMRLYSEEFRKRLEDRKKNTKIESRLYVQIQTQ